LGQHFSSFRTTVCSLQVS